MLGSPGRLLLAVTFAAVAGIGIALLVLLWMHPLRENGLDFQAFYCGGKALIEHANPYLNQPLHDCERATSPSFFSLYPNVTVPAPLPAYALALFIPFALLPYALAKTLWFILLLGCTALTAWLISRLAHLPLSVSSAACAVAILGPAVLQLALAPLPIALLTATALLVSRQRWNAAAVCMTGAMIEPHVALPAALALFMWVPQLRMRLAAGALVLGLASIALIGPQTFLWYFTVLLPTHAGSELNNIGQFSLTTLLFHAGVAAGTALRIGSLQYLAMLVFGLFGARVLAQRFGERAFLVAAPVACSVMGGSFIHLSEIAVAIPLACLLAQRTRSQFAWCAVALLAVPWEAVFNWAFLAPFSVISIAWIVWYRWKPAPVLLVAGSLSLLVISLRLHAVSVGEFVRAHAGSMSIPAAAPGASSDVTWAAFNALAPGTSFWWLQKSMTFAALVLLVSILARIAWTRNQELKMI